MQKESQISEPVLASDQFSPTLEELPALSSPGQVSNVLGVPTGTLAFWRFEGKELPFVKMGRIIKYRRKDVLDYIDKHVYSSTTEAKDSR